MSSLDLANSSKRSSKIIASFRLNTEKFLSSMWVYVALTGRNKSAVIAAIMTSDRPVRVLQKANLGKQVTKSAVVAIFVFGITKQLCL